MQSLALPFFCCLHLLHLWCLCHLDLTRLQPVRGSCDTNHNPAFILLYQPHPLSLPLFSPCKTYSTLSLSLPPSLACPPPLIPLPLVSLFSHFLSHLLPNSLSSDLASLWPTPSIPSLQPASLPPQLSTA